jgi:DNA-directed RNA polymerase subunit H (RpoH/RPB5)
MNEYPSDNEDIECSLDADTNEREDTDDHSSDEQMSDDVSSEDEEDKTEANHEDENEEENEEEKRESKRRKANPKFVFGESTRLFQEYIGMLPGGQIKEAESHHRRDIRSQENKKDDVDRVVAQMIASRGFIPNDQLKNTKTINPEVLEVCQHVKSNLTTETEVTMATNIEGDLLVYFRPSQPRITAKKAREIQQVLEKWKFAHIIIVSDQGCTAVGRKIIIEAAKHANIFTRNQLSKNYINHKFIPIQSELSNAEVAAHLHKFKITKKEISTLLRSDPVCQYYGWVPGVVVKSRMVIGGAVPPFDSFRVVR